MTSLDDLRAAFPALGFAVYAYAPGGVVTLEVLDGDNTFTFQGLTLTAAIHSAFPPPAPAPEPPPPEPEQAQPKPTVFD